MFIMRSTDEAIEQGKSMPFEEMINAMGVYNESLINAGVMIDAEGLAAAEEGFVVDFDAKPPTMTDGPYGATQALFNGFWIIEAASKEEAFAWASRCPLGPGNKLEVRRVGDDSDFAEYSENEYVKKEKIWRNEAHRL